MLGKVSCGIWRNMRLEIISKDAWIDYLEKEEAKKRDTSILKVAGNGVIFLESMCLCMRIDLGILIWTGESEGEKDEEAKTTAK